MKTPKLTVKEFARRKAEEAARKNEVLLKIEEDARSGTLLQKEGENISTKTPPKEEEGRKSHPLPITTTTEEEEDPSLQVDYELSDSSPISSPKKNNLTEVVSSEREEVGETNSKVSPTQNIKSDDKSADLSSENTLEEKKPVDFSSLSSFSDEGFFEKLDEVNKGIYISCWPWEEDVQKVKHLTSFTAGSPAAPSYGDARSFKEDPRSPDTLYVSREDPARSMHFQTLFWKSKYFDNKRLSTDLKALTQSWQAFHQRFNVSPSEWHENLDAKIKAFRENHRSPKGFIYDIHCKTVDEKGTPCGVRYRHCPYCCPGQEKISEEELQGYVTSKLSSETRALIREFEKAFPFATEREVLFGDEPSHTRGSCREYPSKGSSEAPRSSKKVDIPANARGTRGSSRSGGRQHVDESRVTQRSTTYSPDYQSGELEEGEEYDPSSPSFSPSRAYRYYSQRAGAPVSRHSRPLPSPPPDLRQLERDLLEERYLRAQLQTQVLAAAQQMSQMKDRLQETETKLAVLERDYRHSLTLLQQQGVLKGVLKKRRTGGTSSDDQHKTSDASAST